MLWLGKIVWAVNRDIGGYYHVFSEVKNGMRNTQWHKQ